MPGHKHSIHVSAMPAGDSDPDSDEEKWLLRESTRTLDAVRSLPAAPTCPWPLLQPMSPSPRTHAALSEVAPHLGYRARKAGGQSRTMRAAERLGACSGTRDDFLQAHVAEELALEDELHGEGLYMPACGPLFFGLGSLGSLVCLFVAHALGSKDAPTSTVALALAAATGGSVAILGYAHIASEPVSNRLLPLPHSRA